MGFSDLIRDAKSRDDYWIEDATLQFILKLQKLMEARGMSRTDLANRLQVSQPYITRVLKGRDNLTVATMVKLARAVGANLQISLDETETEHKEEPAPRQAVRK